MTRDPFNVTVFECGSCNATVDYDRELGDATITTPLVFKVRVSLYFISKIENEQFCFLQDMGWRYCYTPQKRNIYFDGKTLIFLLKAFDYYTGMTSFCPRMPLFASPSFLSSFDIDNN